MNFEFDNNIPIYVQLVDSLKRYIVSGNLKPGDKIPSVRELSSLAKVNPNTMQKALGELEDLKLIYTERTTGKYVTRDEKIINNIKKEYAKSLIKTYIEGMNALGFSKEEAIDILRKG